jgi:hypothetical protein
MGQWSGGCACGAIRFACDGDPTLMLKCHCRDCQRASGSGHAAVVVFPNATVAISGEPRYYRTTGGSGKPIQRGFCSTCGSPVAVRLGTSPDLIGFYAASLDDPARYKPAMDIFTASAHPWDLMHEETIKKSGGIRG